MAEECVLKTIFLMIGPPLFLCLRTSVWCSGVICQNCARLPSIRSVLLLLSYITASL